MKASKHSTLTVAQKTTIVMGVDLSLYRSAMLYNLMVNLILACVTCEKVIHFSEFTVLTIAHMLELLNTGETNLEEEEEKKNGLQLQYDLGCSCISRLKRMKTPITPNQCSVCFRYSAYYNLT